jgi:hypothetical protein
VVAVGGVVKDVSYSKVDEDPGKKKGSVLDYGRY